MKTKNLNWFIPDEMDAFIYAIVDVVTFMSRSLDTTLIKNDMASIKSAIKYLSQKAKIFDNRGILVI